MWKVNVAKACDTHHYAEWDSVAGAYCVFGDHSGFAYASYATLGDAIGEANRLNAEREAAARERNKRS